MVLFTNFACIIPEINNSLAVFMAVCVFASPNPKFWKLLLFLTIKNTQVIRLMKIRNKYLFSKYVTFLGIFLFCHFFPLFFYAPFCREISHISMSFILFFAEMKFFPNSSEGPLFKWESILFRGNRAVTSRGWWTMLERYQRGLTSWTHWTYDVDSRLQDHGTVGREGKVARVIEIENGSDRGGEKTIACNLRPRVTSTYIIVPNNVAWARLKNASLFRLKFSSRRMIDARKCKDMHFLFIFLRAR